ncbi:MAG: DUF4150 domain-containing protein [Planctomycetes bacterium]|nr:DUF4150 domain-containing protein [Planctomycetota bacterium]
MFPASNKAAGQCMGMPDVCNVPAPPAPPVPTPFPNIAMCAQAQPGSFSLKVKVGGANALVQTSKITMSSGDEAGSLGGVMSGMIKGPCEYKMGSMKVKFEGKGAAHLTSMVAQNGSNPNVPAGQQIAPSQVVVMVN